MPLKPVINTAGLLVGTRNPWYLVTTRRKKEKEKEKSLRAP
jgi:hypothetical protein